MNRQPLHSYILDTQRILYTCTTYKYNTPPQDLQLITSYSLSSTNCLWQLLLSSSLRMTTPQEDVWLILKSTCDSSSSWHVPTPQEDVWLLLKSTCDSSSSWHVTTPQEDVWLLLKLACDYSSSRRVTPFERN